MYNIYPASVQTIQGAKWGYINEQRQFLIQPQYEEAFSFQENGLAAIRVGELFGLIDRTGQSVVKPQYGTLPVFSEGRAAVISGNSFQVIDERGRAITSKPYSYIGAYVEERAFASRKDNQEREVYGYLDRDGEEVISFSYDMVSDFRDGKAVVQKAGNYFLIRKNGEILQTYSYPFVGHYGEGLLVFQEKAGGFYGYMNEAGQLVIQPHYTGAQRFQDGTAVVNTAADYQNQYGLIHKQGRFVLEPVYNEIRLLGEERAAVGKAIDEKQPFIGSRYAIATTAGKFLTDFLYYEVGEYKNGLASVSDEDRTFFVGRNGRAAMNLPILKGNGAVRIEGALVAAQLDQRLSYHTRFGNVVWQESNTVRLDDSYIVRQEKEKSNRNYLVYYPRIEGMKDKAAQQQANQRLKQLSKVKSIKQDEQLLYSYTGDYSLAMFQKQLLVLQMTGYEFFFGAAHGMPSKVYAHVDLDSGRFYELKDLFLANSNYVEVLSAIIQQQIAVDSQYSYVFPDAYKGIMPDQPFYVSQTALHIYFTPYEIAPFAAGFPTFIIPYLRIQELIDEKGAFWQSFH